MADSTSVATNIVLVEIHVSETKQNDMTCRKDRGLQG